MLFVDPARLARRQIEIDRKRTARFPHLLSHKESRMLASPLALLRGSAPLFYELLAAHPTLAEGPPGEGWLVGDAHVENFGAYRTGALHVGETAASRASEHIVFDLNDFDDACIGPFRYDVLRLTTSLVLGSREVGVDGPNAIALAQTLIDGYVVALFEENAPPTRPAVVEALVKSVRSRSRKALLDARTEVVRGHRRFVRGPRYEALPAKLQARAERAFEKYVGRLAAEERPPAEALQVVDAAFRVAGTGSLGGLRVALLVRGKGSLHGAWIFDMKAESTPSAASLVRASSVLRDLEPAERVCAALRACLSHPPRMIGATRLRGASMFVRRLAPQEDKIEFARVAPSDLDGIARYFGALLGSAHRRGAARLPKSAWTQEDRANILARCLALAGLHEATYLAYCSLARR